MQLQEEVGGVANEWNQIGASPKKQRLIALYEDLVGDRVRAKTGAAATEGERAAVRKTMPLEKMFGPDSKLALEGHLANVVDATDNDVGTFVRGPNGEAVTFSYRESADRLRAKHGLGAGNEALPDLSINTAKLQLKEAAKHPERPDAMLRAVEGSLAAARNADATTASGRARLESLRKDLSKLPTGLRSLPDVNGDVDPVEVIDVLLGVGSLKKQGAEDAEQRKRESITTVTPEQQMPWRYRK